jgi:hypothetical protein
VLKKVATSAEIPSVAKATLEEKALTTRLKSRPFKAESFSSL